MVWGLGMVQSRSGGGQEVMGSGAGGSLGVVGVLGMVEV